MLAGMPLLGKEILILTSDLVEGELIYPGIVKEGPDGKIYASDYRDYYIKVYSQDGRYIRRIGGKGEGPGQMKRMGAFGFSADKKFLFFTEYFNGHRWITFTDLNGDFEKVFKINIKGNYGTWKTVMLPGNRFLAEIHDANVNSVKKKSNYFEYYSSKKLVIINSKGIIEREILRRRHVSSLSMVSTGADITIPFPPEFLWHQYANMVIFTDGLSPNLKIFNYAGEKVGEIETPIPGPEKVTKKDLENWKNSIKESAAYKRHVGLYRISGKILDLYKKSIFSKKPNVSGLSITPDGNILLEGPCYNVNQPVHYWLLNKKGKSICEIKLKSQGLRITRNFVLYKNIDVDENETVCLMKRENSEKSDFLKLEREKKVPDKK
jgi:hypothetical protein